MAPSTKATCTQLGKKQLNISAFGRISKASSTASSQKAWVAKVAPTVQLPETAGACRGSGRKRRHDAIDEEESCNLEEQFGTRLLKKPRIQSLPSGTSSHAIADAKAPPISAKPVTTTNLPLSLRSILTLHENFLKALSIHFAHNGLSTPAELGSLLKTVTCLWKKHAVRKEDIQRMLALYEISAEQDRSAVFQPGCSVSHDKGPFQLTSSGAARSVRVCVDYAGARDGDSSGLVRRPFSEKDLQYLFELDLLCLYQASRNKSNTHLAFLSGPLADFPLLCCTIGTQSAIRQEKASARRADILSKSSASQQRQQEKPTTSADPFTEVPCKTDTEVTHAFKSRAQSLFDRIAARQAVNASSSVPTAASILRWHAVSRISEIVEILRMKQQQKSVGRNHMLSNTNTTNPTKPGQRVSFSMKQLQIEIRDSASVPVGDEEIRLCLKMLAEEGAAGNWLKIVESGFGERMSAFVVLEGRGLPGRDVQKMFEENMV